MNESHQQLDDDALLEAVARLWRQLDPPPADLAHGVLARIAAEDLELELLTLVESSDDALAGVRSSDTVEDADELTSTSLEYVGPDLRVYVHLSQFDDGTRLDGWVVPARRPDRDAARRAGNHRAAADLRGPARPVRLRARRVRRRPPDLHRRAAHDGAAASHTTLPHLRRPWTPSSQSRASARLRPASQPFPPSASLMSRRGTSWTR